MDDENEGETPAELRALVDFLDVDHRPTAILRPRGQANQVPYTVVWRNRSFLGQTNNAEECEDVLQAVERTLKLKRELSALHGQELEGKRWHARIAGGCCIAVAVDGRKALNAAQNGRKRGSTEHEVSWDTNGQHASTSQQAAHGASRYLDWTQNAIPNMSPWIRFLREVDWASTGVGPMQTWPLPLRQYVLAIMANPNPRLLVWGDDMVFIYNEACVQLFGKKHPEAMGQHTSQAFAEAWPSIRPLIDNVLTGEVSSVKHAPMHIERKGFLEETYWDFTLLPILNDEGYCVGALDEITETTISVTAARRGEAVIDLTQVLESARTTRDIWHAVIKALGAATLDVPFALLYVVVDDSPEGGDGQSESTTSTSSSSARPKKCVLAGTVGVNEDHPDLINTFALLEHQETGPGIAAPCLEAWRTNTVVKLTASGGSLPTGLAAVVPGRGFDDKIETALVSPIKATTGNDILGILVTGLNPRTLFEGEYKLWMTLTVSLIEKTAALISLPEEQRRAQQISDDINNALAQQLRLTTLQAEKSEAKFSRLAETAPTGMFMFDGEGRVLYINDTYAEMLGGTRDDISARTPNAHHLKDSVHEDDLDRFLNAWPELKEKKIPITLEYRLKNPWVSFDRSTGQELTGET